MAQLSDNQFFTLIKAPSNQGLVLQSVADKALKLKLLEMGVLPNSCIEKLRIAPSKGLVMLKMYPNGSLFAMRYEDAEKVMVKIK